MTIFDIITDWVMLIGGAGVVVAIWICIFMMIGMIWESYKENK